MSILTAFFLFVDLHDFIRLVIVGVPLWFVLAATAIATDVKRLILLVVLLLVITTEVNEGQNDDDNIGNNSRLLLKRYRNNRPS